LRDNKDVDTLLQLITVHSPIPSNQELMSPPTGAVGGNTINCYSTLTAGTAAMHKIEGKAFGDIHLYPKDKEDLPLYSVTNSVKV